MHENKPLTAIRGIAALYVVCYHLNSWVQPGTDIVPRSVFGYGYSAVDIFFILSGFILATVYGGTTLTLGESWRFLLKRIVRLYPLHIAIMAFLAVAIAASPTLHVPMHSDQFHAWHSYPYVFFLIQPFTASEGGWNNPSWSIGIELLCYLLFPLLIVNLRVAPRVLMWPMLLSLAAAQAFLLITAFDATSGSDALMRGLFGFFFGVTLRLVLQAIPPPSPLQASVIGLAACAGLVGAASFNAANLIPLASAILIASLLSKRGVVASVLSTGLMVWLGRISFSIYLLHDPVTRIAGKLFPLSRVPFPMPIAGWVYAAAILSVVITLATFTHRWIEEPGRDLFRSRYNALPISSNDVPEIVILA